MPKSTMTQRLLAEVEESKQELLGNIDEAIAKIEKRMAPYEALNSKKLELVAARRALLGGARLTGGSGGQRIRQEDVVDGLRGVAEGLTSQELADKLSGPEPSIRSHLNRGKDERFLKKGHRWFLRDPKNGINTVEDLPDEGDVDEDE